MISLIITILIDYKKNKHIGDKNPRVTRGYPQTRWVRVWAKSQTRHGYGFFNGHRYFSRVRVWEGKNPVGLYPLPSLILMNIVWKSCGCVRVFDSALRSDKKNTRTHTFLLDKQKETGSEVYSSPSSLVLRSTGVFFCKKVPWRSSWRKKIVVSPYTNNRIRVLCQIIFSLKHVEERLEGSEVPLVLCKQKCFWFPLLWIPLRACSVLPQSIWIEGDWGGFNP